MSVNKIIVKGGRKVAMPVNKEEYLNTRGSQYVKDLLELVRSGANPKAKLQLPQFNYSGYYPDGVVKGNKLPSKAFVFDIDDRDEFLRAKAALLADPDRYGLLMLERSVNYGGHAVFKRQPGRTILENQVRVAMELGCEMDTNAHDINRVLFTTSDSEEDLLYLSDELFEDRCDAASAKAEAALLEERERNGMEEVPPSAHRAEKHFRPGTSKEVQKFRSSEVQTNVSGATKPIETVETTGTIGTTETVETPETTETAAQALEYNGIPYSEIIDKWWEMHYDGHTPVKSNRNTLTYTLANNLRHICGFDRELLAKIIPNYDGFSDAEKMQCIDSALAGHMTQLPKRMVQVLEFFRKKKEEVGENVEELAAVLEEAETYVNDNIQCVPQGFRDSIEAVGPALTMPAIISTASCVGALATGVSLDVHGDSKALNILSFVVGEFGSGKGSIGPIINAWMHELKLKDKVYLEQEAEYREQKRNAKNKKEQPVEVKYPVRYITLNNTVANLADRLANTQGMHAFSFTPEADIVAQKWGSALGDFSTILREAYDNDEYCREAKSADAVNVHIDAVKWNVVLCGTPGALHRVVRNYEDGFQSRITLASTPDNTFAPLVRTPRRLSDENTKHIHQIAHLLPLCEGAVMLDKLEDTGCDWLEVVRLSSLKNDDSIRARQRFRVCVSTQRILCCMMLCAMLEKLLQREGSLEKAEYYLKTKPQAWKELLAAEQTPEMLSNFAILADTLLDTNLYYFKMKLTESAIENALTLADVRISHENENVFSSLPAEFKYADALRAARAIKGATVTENAVSLMLRKWRKQSLVTYDIPTKRYIKVSGQ